MRSLDRSIILLVLAAAVACSKNDSRTASGAELPASLRKATSDTANPIPIPASTQGAAARVVELPPLADSIAQWIVFVPRTQTLFTAAARGKRMLVDIGRVDAEVRKDPVRKQAYLLAVSRLSPLPIGARMRIRGPWGASPATVIGFDTWNGRVVATLRVPAKLDSLVRHRDLLPAAALRVDAATAAADSARADSTARAAGTATGPGATPADAAAATASCAADSVPPLLIERARVIRDSVEQALRALEMPQIDRLLTSVKVTSSQAPGCYGSLGRLLLIVPNRRGVWSRIDTTPFGQGLPFSRQQLERQLTDGLFTPIDWSEALYFPPFDKRLMLRMAPTLERAGGRLSLGVAGVIIVEARKEIMAPIGGGLKVEAVRVLKPAANTGRN